MSGTDFHLCLLSLKPELLIDGSDLYNSLNNKNKNHVWYPREETLTTRICDLTLQWQIDPKDQCGDMEQ